MGNDSKKKRTVEFKTRLPLHEALGYLRDLHAALESGTAYLRHENRVLELRPSDTVVLEVEGEEKDGKQSIEIEIGWVARQQEGDGEDAVPFTITTEAPVIEAEEDGSDEDDEEDQDDDDEGEKDGGDEEEDDDDEDEDAHDEEDEDESKRNE